MNNDFLVKFMHAARAITRMERGMVVDSNLELVDAVNLPQSVLASAPFQEVASAAIQRALQRQEAIITNNMITDPSQAPVTNTNFADLRVVVIFPLMGYGALYLDQHIRYGIVQRDVVNKVMSLATHILEHGLEDTSEDQMIALYEQIG